VINTVWVPIADPADRRRVVYWRLETKEHVRYLGAVSRITPGEFRALLYGPDGRPGRSHEGRTELGHHPTKAAAQRAVERAARSRG
jgi:hypothetical protein